MTQDIYQFLLTLDSLFLLFASPPLCFRTSPLVRVLFPVLPFARGTCPGWYDHQHTSCVLVDTASERVMATSIYEEDDRAITLASARLLEPVRGII